LPVPWLIVPTYQEAENVEQIVARAQAVLRTASPAGFRILIVDDHSPDGTGDIADRLAAEFPGEVLVLHREGPRGLGPAYLAGFDRALAGGASHAGDGRRRFA
jgi:dolichol-phosphate mannosyltransferase